MSIARGTVLVFALGLLGSAESAQAMAMRVAVGDLNVRAGPGTNYAVLGQIHQGQVYPSVQQQGDWQRIQWGEQQAWCYGPYLTRSQEQVQSVTASALNVRSGPGTGYRILGTLRDGAPVAILGTSGAWRQVWFAGQRAWVHGGYLGATGSGGGGGGSRPVSRAGFIGLGASGPGFYSYTTAGRRWGTPRLVYATERVGRRLAQEGRPRMGTGDISLTDGGYFPPHVSHRLGVDIDVRPGRTSGEGPVTITQSLYSRERTQRMIDLYRQEVSTRLVLFNDSRVRGVQYYSGHHNHFHLRTW
jgi:uncharacterized protein YraI